MTSKWPHFYGIQSWKNFTFDPLAIYFFIGLGLYWSGIYKVQCKRCWCRCSRVRIPFIEVTTCFHSHDVLSPDDAWFLSLGAWWRIRCYTNPCYHAYRYLSIWPTLIMQLKACWLPSYGEYKVTQPQKKNNLLVSSLLQYLAVHIGLATKIEH